MSHKNQCCRVLFSRKSESRVVDLAFPWFSKQLLELLGPEIPFVFRIPDHSQLDDLPVRPQHENRSMRRVYAKTSDLDSAPKNKA